MRSVTDLAKLRAAVLARTLRLKLLFQARGEFPDNGQTALLGHLVIELDNLVIGGLRQITISSLSNARRLDGRRVRTHRDFSSEQEISAFIMSTINVGKYKRIGSPASLPRSEEPTIRFPKDTLKVLKAGGASNAGSVDRAISLNSAVFNDLPTFRNFYAHRNADTYRKVVRRALAWGVGKVGQVDELVTNPMPGRPVEAIVDWLSDVRLFFELSLDS